MSATEIIDEIKHLPVSEQTQVITFVHSLESRMLSGNELAELADKFIEATDPAEKEALRERLTRGFYGE